MPIYITQFLFGFIDYNWHHSALRTNTVEFSYFWALKRLGEVRGSRAAASYQGCSEMPGRGLSSVLRGWGLSSRAVNGAAGVKGESGKRREPQARTGMASPGSSTNWQGNSTKYGACEFSGEEGSSDGAPDRPGAGEVIAGSRGNQQKKPILTPFEENE